MLNCHESTYYRLSEDDYLYTEIRNGLNALVSRNVDNVFDAIDELYSFCVREHGLPITTITAPLCECCEITKDLLEEVCNNPYIEPVNFYYD